MTTAAVARRILRPGKAGRPIQSVRQPWVGQLWATAHGMSHEVVRVTAIDPYVGLVEVEGHGHVTAVVPIAEFLARHRRLPDPSDRRRRRWGRQRRRFANGPFDRHA